MEKQSRHSNDRKIEARYKDKNPLDEVLDQLHEYEKDTPPRKETDRCCPGEKD